MKSEIIIKEDGLLGLLSMIRESEIIWLKLIIIHFRENDDLTKVRFNELMIIAHKKMVDNRK